MKTTLQLLLTCLTLFLFQNSFSQAICGFDAVHARKMKEDPSYRKNILAGEASIRTYIANHPQLTQPPKSVTVDKAGAPTTLGTPSTLGTPLYTIPVVVHIVHTGGAVGSVYNPTDAQITGAISYLNAVYNGTYPGIQGAGDLQIQFVLAQRDPNCNPTNGINRIDGSSVSGYVSGGVQAAQTTIGTADINIKNLDRWNTSQYYNVWVVNKIDGNDGTTGTFIAGFAYFPGASASEDGIVMLATQMISGQKTLPHEIGHAFSLYHPFEGSTNVTICPLNTNCNLQGDQVCDTDPISYNVNGGVIDFSCRTGTNTCTGTAYSINTESNFMNYTNCYTLFTPGQKARMQASAAGVYRASLSSSLGGTPPSGGSSPCIPKIDFEFTDDQQTETTAATSGCRAYKDYSYNMVIGSAPTAAATATLNVSSGTATQGLDFDITTNGSFTAPSATLNFPAGSTASQPFTIRIYDDASVNGTRQFTLGFTVNGGSGNAVAGDGRPNFTMTINDNDQAPTAGVLPTGVSNIGAALGTIAGLGPFDATQSSYKAQILYKASELTAAGIPAGPLSGISFNLVKASTRAFSNFNIKLGTSSATYLVNAGTLTIGAPMTIVKTLATYNTVNGWNNFTFDTPYTWDGTSNLVVEICFDNGTAASGDAVDQCQLYNDGAAGSQGNIFWQNSINCSQSYSSVTYEALYKPIIKLGYGIATTLVQTVLNSSIQQYLGPNADIYFYDQANGQLMARIQNLSTFNYGCTQVIIDRAGTNATQFWNNNIPNYLMDKTFHVVPTTNNSSGSYNITLFYTQAEVTGWQSITGQNISSIQLVKVPTQISNVTVANPTGGDPVTLVTPTITTLGTNTALTYNFTNGFSGFGAGVPGLSVLPIGLLNFEGQLNNNNTLLDWTTSFESGSKGFEIDRSYDGTSFTSIGYVAAAGHSSTGRYYSFTDPSIAQDNNYYRLKEIDQDGKVTYSKIVLVKDPNLTTSAFTVLSNPFTDHIDIVFGQSPAGKVGVRLLDMAGRELLSRSGDASAGSRMRIDLSGTTISSGIYLLELRFNNGVLTQKLLKN
ncbi:MAG TPA: M43 family zinc metalloprotease [Puia sp.]|nr:M43 family zinc metalloprotease [Puia sp.]